MRAMREKKKKCRNLVFFLIYAGGLSTNLGGVHQVVQARTLVLGNAGLLGLCLHLASQLEKKNSGAGVIVGSATGAIITVALKVVTIVVCSVKRLDLGAEFTRPQLWIVLVCRSRKFHQLLVDAYIIYNVERKDLPVFVPFKVLGPGVPFWAVGNITLVFALVYTRDIETSAL